ncbi:hypothetical protein VTK73DRAFT_7971 [Phialemonium thermophilum]|uniref:DUF4396 domain-containing protein n=1 Tax=Phialemonium thermophilum TaxID=223376 RepID=A0ABR3WBN8_9PEZI
MNLTPRVLRPRADPLWRLSCQSACFLRHSCIASRRVQTVSGPADTRPNCHTKPLSKDGLRSGPTNTTTHACQSSGHQQATTRSQSSMATLEFWSSASTWRRAAVNTFRCLVGCTSGDFAAMWFLQAHYPGFGVASIMALSMASGLTTSLLLETAFLRLGRDALPTWGLAARTAAGMSLVSMLAMEAAENAVDYYLTGGGCVALDSPAFWGAALAAAAAGFVAPLPYNYMRLRMYGKGCH